MMAKMDPDEVNRRLQEEAADEALARKLDADPDFAKDFDESFARGFKGFENDLLNKIADDKGMSASERDAMMKAAERARKAAQGGFLTKPDPAKAEKIIMGNRGLREAKKRSGKGCAVLALVLTSGGLAALAGLTYAASEIIRAVGF